MSDVDASVGAASLGAGDSSYDGPFIADLEDVYLDETLVLVGCGASKRDPEDPVDLHQAVVDPGEEVRGPAGPIGPAWEARDLYTSTYFQLKREFAERVTAWRQGDNGYACGWAILSAEHYVVDPGAPLTPYDTTVDDLGSDPTNMDHHSSQAGYRRPDGQEVVTEMDAWARMVATSLHKWVAGHTDDIRTHPDDHRFTLLVLAGQSYVEPLRERGVFEYGNARMVGDPNDTRFSLPVEPRFLFEEIDADGIGEQMAWLSDAVGRLDDAPDHGEQGDLSGWST